MTAVLGAKTLRFTLWAMCQPKTFYVLGAGASVGLVPLTPELRSHVARRFDEIGIYPTSPAAHSPLFERVIGAVCVDGRGFRSLLLRNIAPGTLDLLVQRGLWRPVDGIVPPQYAVFDAVGRPATIFSFNLDDLASAYCSNMHHVLEPHGSIDRHWLEASNYEELLEATSEYDLVLPHITRKHLPGPEPSGITEQTVYARARGLFRQSSALLLVGYSFGKWQGIFDDAESFEYFVDLLLTYPRPVIVLSPYPEELVDVLQQRLRCRRVYGLPIRWEVLSGVILGAVLPPHDFRSVLSDEQIKAFQYAYYRADEASQSA